MRALVSMQDGVALILGRAPKILSLDHEPQLMATEEDGLRLVAGAPDAEWIDVDDERTLIRRVEAGWRRDRVRRLLTMILNSESSAAAAELSAEAVEDLLVEVEAANAEQQSLTISMKADADFVRAWKLGLGHPKLSALIAFIRREFVRQVVNAHVAEPPSAAQPILMTSGKIVGFDAETATGLVLSPEGQELVFDAGERDGATAFKLGQSVWFIAPGAGEVRVAIDVWPRRSGERSRTINRLKAIAEARIRARKGRLIVGEVRVKSPGYAAYGDEGVVEH